MRKPRAREGAYRPTSIEGKVPSHQPQETQTAMPFKDGKYAGKYARSYQYKMGLPARIEKTRAKLDFLESEARRLDVYHLVLPRKTQTNDN